LRTSIGDVTVPDVDELADHEDHEPDARTSAPRAAELASTVEQTASDASAHTEIQGLLLRLGSAMGMDVWVARNDRNRLWEGRTFAETFKLRAELPITSTWRRAASSR
jgi:hypothetical protein